MMSSFFLWYFALSLAFLVWAIFFNDDDESRAVLDRFNLHPYMVIVAIVIVAIAWPLAIIYFIIWGKE